MAISFSFKFNIDRGIDVAFIKSLLISRRKHMWCHFTRRTKAELACVLMTLNFLMLTMEYIRNSRLCILLCCGVFGVVC